MNIKTTLIAALAAMTIATTASAGVYEHNFATHYNDSEGKPANATELYSKCNDSTSSYGWTGLAVVAPAYNEFGEIATALAQNESVHWSHINDGWKLKYAVGLMAVDYAVKAQQFDACARNNGYELQDFTTEVINRSYNFGE